MKNFKKIIFHLFFFLFLTSNLFAENNVSYIDLDKILANTESVSTCPVNQAL